jgi:hypothetical protein
MAMTILCLLSCCLCITGVGAELQVMVTVLNRDTFAKKRVWLLYLKISIWLLLHNPQKEREARYYLARMVRFPDSAPKKSIQ